MKAHQVRDLERGKSSPSINVVLKVSEVYGKPLRWLITGEGSSSAGQGEPTYDLQTIREILGRITDVRPYVVWKSAGEGEINPDDYRAVPVLADAAAAGRGAVMRDDIEEFALIHQRVVPHPERVRCVRVKGDSMSPTLPDGSIVAVDIESRDPRQANGRIVCARTSEDEVVIKRWRDAQSDVILMSDNQDHESFPPIVLRPDDLEREPLIGIVVWAWVDLRK